MRSARKIFFTTIALTLTSFLMKTVGVWFNVYLTGLVGTVGIGIFQLVMSVYAMAKTLACGGMNLSATRLCIDDPEHQRHSMKRVLECAFILGFLSLIILYFFARPISEYWIMTDRATLSLKILSFSLPFISLSAALNGYMTAVRKMGRYSIIQLLEQIAKITLTVVLIAKIGKGDMEFSIALVCLAITISEVISFLLALVSYLSDVYRWGPDAGKSQNFGRKMARLAIPDALGSYIRSALNTVEHLLIPRGIRKSGLGVDKAFSDYGLVQGMALPVLLYPSSILGVLSGLLVPEIAECKRKKNLVQVHYIINRVLHIAMIFSMVTMAAMLIFADEISLAVYSSTSCATFIRQIAPLIPIMYLDMTTDGMLKGLDLQLDIMKINILDSVLCVVLVFFLVPKIAVDGYIITIYVAEIINFLFSFYKLIRVSKVKFGVFKNFVKPAASSFFALFFSKRICLGHFAPTLSLVLSIVLGCVVYYLLLRLSRGITKEDSLWFKSLIKS